MAVETETHPSQNITAIDVADVRRWRVFFFVLLGIGVLYLLTIVVMGYTNRPDLVKRLAPYIRLIPHSTVERASVEHFGGSIDAHVIATFSLPSKISLAEVARRLSALNHFSFIQEQVPTETGTKPVNKWVGHNKGMMYQMTEDYGGRFTLLIDHETVPVFAGTARAPMAHAWVSPPYTHPVTPPGKSRVPRLPISARTE